MQFPATLDKADLRRAPRRGNATGAGGTGRGRRAPGPVLELQAVVSHLGPGWAHGHFVACVQTRDRMWVACDDSQLQPLPRAAVGTQGDAYILM